MDSLKPAWPGGNFRHIQDTAAGNAKTYTVASNEELVVYQIAGEISATATVGNRVLYVVIQDASNNILWSSTATAAITAGQKGLIIANSCGLTNTTVRLSRAGAAVNVALLDGSMPILHLRKGYKIKVYDLTNVDAADTLSTVIHCRQVLK